MFTLQVHLDDATSIVHAAALLELLEKGTGATAPDRLLVGSFFWLHEQLLGWIETDYDEGCFNEEMIADLRLMANRLRKLANDMDGILSKEE